MTNGEDIFVFEVMKQRLLKQCLFFGDTGNNNNNNNDSNNGLLISLETDIHATQREMGQVKNRYLKEKLDQVKGSVSGKTLRAVDLATQKEASSWLTVFAN